MRAVKSNSLDDKFGLCIGLSKNKYPIKAKIQESIKIRSTVGQFSLHANTTSKDMKLIVFSTAHNMVVLAPSYSISTFTITSSHHTVIDERHVSSVLDVRTFRGPSINSDHYLVAAKFRLRISTSRSAHSSALRKLDVKKLRSQRTVEAFSA